MGYLYRDGRPVDVDRADFHTVMCLIYTILIVRLCRSVVPSQHECGEKVSVLSVSDGT